MQYNTGDILIICFREQLMRKRFTISLEDNKGCSEYSKFPR